jgi:hypothetical protein
LKGLVNQQSWRTELQDGGAEAFSLFTRLVEDQDSARFLGVNRYLDTLWIRQEDLDEYLDWLLLIDTLQSDRSSDERPVKAGSGDPEEILDTIRSAASEMGYQVDPILSELKSSREKSSGSPADNPDKEGKEN